MFRNVQNLKNKLLRNFRNFRAGSPTVKIKNGSSSVKPSKFKSISLKSRFARVLIGIFIAMIILSGVYAISIYFSFKTEVYDMEIEKQSNLRNSDEINVLFLVLDDRLTDYKFIQNATLISSNSKSAMSRMISIDTNFLINFNGQRNKLFSVFNNLPSDNEFDRMSFLKRSISLTLGIRIDRYIAINASDYKKFCTDNLGLKAEQMADFFEKFNLKYQNEVVSKTILNFSYITSIFDRFYNNDTFNHNFKTDLLASDFNYFIGLYASVGEKNIQAIEINKSMITEEDKNGVYIPNYTLIDEAVKKTFRDIDILKEQVRVELYNSTTQGGLATSYRRLLENNNMNVIKFGNYPEILEKTKLFVINSENLPLYSNTLTTLRRNIPVEFEVTTEEYKYNSSGDIILVLGNDVVSK